MKNQMELVFDAVSQNEAFARVTAGAFFSQLNPTLETMADVKTAVSEAVTNAIVHGYQNRPGKVKMTCTIENDLLTVVIEDNGVGISDVDKARQPFYTTGPREERSGMGFAVMEAFMDALNVQSSEGKGTRVEMKKRATPGTEAMEDA